MELKDFLAWLVTGGGAGVIAYVLVDQVAWLQELAPRTKRLAAIVLSAVLAILGYLVMMAMGYEAWPLTVYQWIERLFFYATSAFTLSQIIHGQRDLPGVRFTELPDDPAEQS